MIETKVKKRSREESRFFKRSDRKGGVCKETI
jgi:hypothetical protein